MSDANRLLPWYVRRPHLWQAERSAMAGAYPEFRPCSYTDQLGGIVLHGEVSIRTSREQRKQQLLLRYGDDYPHYAPQVIPLLGDAGIVEPHSVGPLPIKWFSFRHQMADGSLCGFARQSRAARVSGVDALRRAEAWLRDQALGSLSKALDSDGAELEEHYAIQGQIVAGPAVLEAELPPRARLIAVSVSDQRPSFVLTHAETASGWATDRDLLEPFLAQWAAARIPAGFWDKEPTALVTDARSKSSPVWQGMCVTLEQEPPIIRSVETLASLLYPNMADSMATLAHDYGDVLRRDTGLVVAFRFPSRNDSGHDWFFVRLKLREMSQQAAAPDGVMGFIIDTSTDRERIAKAAEIGALRLQDFRRTKLQMRNRGRVSAEAHTFSLILLGAGALGSAVADLLGKAGIGEILVCDPQCLDAGNALRHTAGLFQVGVSKALIVAHGIFSHNPYCRVSSTGASALSSSGPRLADATAAISTIATDDTDLAVNDLATATGATMYYLRAQRSGTVGRLTRCRPGADACFECLQWHYADAYGHLIVPPSEGEVLTHECGAPVLAASAADLMAVAAIGARRILDDLSMPGAVNHWLWTTTGVSGHGRLDLPMASLAETLSPHPSCTTCRPCPVEGVIVVRSVIDQMTQHARSRFPNETGGILVGRRQDQNLLVLAATDSGPNALESPERFRRDGPYSQIRLEQLMRLHGEGTTYLGEWHSHPNLAALPSPTDVAALTEISVDPDYRTDSPLMLIVALAAPEAGPTIGASIYLAGRTGYRVPLTVVTGDISGSSSPIGGSSRE